MTMVGTAGWSIGGELAGAFATEGSSLERYARVLDAVEINSSFYRRHRPQTWQRWADSVPDRFRFAVKLPKTLSHVLGLRDAGEPVDQFIADIAPLGAKLGPLLLQLPPKFTFDADVAGRFFDLLRQRHSGVVVIEPRHLSWADSSATSLLHAFGVTRIAADPSLPELFAAAMAEDFLYLRLHGAPRIYYSSYEQAAIEHFAAALAGPASRDSWCIFDNTASGAALRNALQLRDSLGLGQGKQSHESEAEGG